VPGTFVYLVNPNNTVSVRPVKLGVTEGNRVEIRSGLAPGDHVVIDGADKLRDGAKVAVRPATGAAASPASAAIPGQNKPNGKSGVKGQPSQGRQKP
jgi:multidrug efflux system membrane fusion protein